ncbi:MAG: protein of unknown function DUF3310 [Namikivirus ozawa]|uniref:DUF3310 domain-containing protein n=1 Tax=Bacteriophage sp. TaxID=38018 RepID=A0ABY5TTR1_9VIRU|nr:MAG: protein of unknown function DUF3310 [Bacteriophage sp.]
MTDNVNHPTHYTARDIGYECIVLTKYQYFCTGNVIKYLWRYKDKGNPTEDLEKARWYARKAVARHEQTYTTSTCGIILHKLVQATTGPERIAWHGIRTSDWHTVIKTLDRMIEETNE